MRPLAILLACGIAAAQQVSLPQRVSLLDAVAATLDKHPQLEVRAEQVQIARAAMLEAAGQFNTQVGAQLLQGHTNLPLTGLEQLQVNQAGLGVGNQSSNLTNTSGSVTRLLRSGLELSSSVNLTRTTDNLVQNDGINLSQLRFQAVLPLLRGRGRQNVAANETSAKIDADSALLDLNHMAAALIAETAARYWELAAAVQSLQVLSDAEERGRVFVDNVRTLIEADRLPRAELQQVLANLATRTTNRAGAEQRLIEATQALALAMGSTVEELKLAIRTTDELPDVQSTAPSPMDAAGMENWLSLALTRRADYLSLTKHQAALEVRSRGAANLLKPQLDLRFYTGYSGLNEGRRPDRLVRSIFTNVGGLDVNAGIQYSLPFGNSAARGQLERATATVRQNLASIADLARSISSSILASIGAYRTAIIRVQQAQASVNASQAALDGEREKLRLGVGSVVELLTVEDRLTNARSSYVQARLNYATLLARLRFGTGTLVDPYRPAQSLNREVFFRPPWEDPRP